MYAKTMSVISELVATSRSGVISVNFSTENQLVSSSSGFISCSCLQLSLSMHNLVSMNPISLEAIVRYKLAPARVEELEYEASRAYALQEAAAFGKRYTNALSGFNEVSKVAGFPASSDPLYIRSNPIVLNPTYEDNVFGTGILSATIITYPNEPSASTVFTLTTNDKQHLIYVEKLTAKPFEIRGKTPVLDESGAWIATDLYKNHDGLGATVRDLGEKLTGIVEAAEETLAMLRTAMQNPQFNPGMADAAQNLFTQW
ncbi:MAG: hypothetical protein JWN38_263 [Candidatus Saccharibacteria bacterium]|nr:hypothetical protein [Candidatus Saccharibacteria bacterium]